MKNLYTLYYSGIPVYIAECCLFIQGLPDEAFIERLIGVL